MRAVGRDAGRRVARRMPPTLALVAGVRLVGRTQLVDLGGDLIFAGLQRGGLGFFARLGAVSPEQAASRPAAANRRS